MADEIKQSGRVGGVLPVKRTRDDQRRKQPRNGAAGTQRGTRRRPPSDDQPHRIDEYV